MIGKLARSTIKTPHGKKVYRLVLDVDASQIDKTGMTKQEFVQWLDKKAGKEVSFKVSSVEGEEVGKLGEEEEGGGVEF